ncbi:MAG: ABC transporter ATP-binding protein [Duodenibacillus sp.]|nr:ABC transporter ATP-binding protein [Duodenibacillus sp.]
MNTQSAIAVRGLEKTYPGGACALRGVDLDVGDGEFFGLLGPNGAGKTTLINCLAGLTDPTAGSIAVFGRDAARERRAASAMLGIVPQEITFDLFLTVRETLRFQSGYWGVRGNGAWIDTVLERLGLADKADVMVRSLSGGMKRRVLVAQALVHKPRVIVLDEPTAGVDVTLREHLWDFIGELHREGRTVVLTTHYLEEAQALCRRVAVMKDGGIVALDSTEALLAGFGGRQLRFRLEAGALPGGLLSRAAASPEGLFTIALADDGEAAAILAALADAGCRISGLEIAQPTLHDVFLALTGEGGKA